MARTTLEASVVHPAPDKLLDIYKVMLRIRMFEERVLSLGLRGIIRGSFQFTPARKRSRRAHVPP